MKNELTVRTEVISVEFTCSNYNRMATILAPKFSNHVLSVKATWSNISFDANSKFTRRRKSYANSVSTDILLAPPGGSRFKYNAKCFLTGEYKLDLRWYEYFGLNSDVDIEIQKEGTMELPVEIYYTSVILDRQDKLETLGV
jgi:hypothetical protein